MTDRTDQVTSILENLKRRLHKSCDEGDVYAVAAKINAEALAATNHFRAVFKKDMENSTLDTFSQTVVYERQLTASLIFNEVVYVTTLISQFVAYCLVERASVADLRYGMLALLDEFIETSMQTPDDPTMFTDVDVSDMTMN